MHLYSYWRSSTSFRVRAALNLKGLVYQIVPVDLVEGEQHNEQYLQLNPGAGVPALVLDDGTVLTQSLVILEYLENAYPEPILIPKDFKKRAAHLSVAQVVALDIHPLNNTRVVEHLKKQFGASDEDCVSWMNRWMEKGFAAVERMLPVRNDFAFSDKPGLADICIVGQVNNARRWGMDMSSFRAIRRIEKLCLEIPEIYAAHPDNQPEARETA